MPNVLQGQAKRSTSTSAHPPLTNAQMLDSLSKQFYTSNFRHALTLQTANNVPHASDEPLRATDAESETTGVGGVRSADEVEGLFELGVRL